jgi:hypothetical protein
VAQLNREVVFYLIKVLIISNIAAYALLFSFLFAIYLPFFYGIYHYGTHGISREKLYFCGYDLLEIFGTFFFERLASYNNEVGFCYEEAAIAMMLLKKCKTAKIHQGITMHGFGYPHSWVTFRVGFLVFVMDYRVSPMPKLWSWYKRLLQPETIWTMNYKDFWQLKEVNALYERMKKPETSHFFIEFKFFRPDFFFASNWGFRGYFPLYKIDREDFGKELAISRNDLDEDEYDIYISQRIVDEFMADPKLMRPSDEAIKEAFDLHWPDDERDFFEFVRKNILAPYII